MAKNTELNKIKEWYAENFKTFETKLNGQSKTFLHDIRKDALNKLNDLNFPTIKDEEWKYTNISPILKHNFTPAINADSTSVTRDQLENLLFKDFDYHLMVFVNGLFNEELSDIGDLPEGVTVSALSEVMKSNPGLIENHVKSFNKYYTAFDALNTSYASDGLVVHIPDGKVVEKPIQVLYLNGNETVEIFSSPRNIIIAGKNAQVSVLANYRGIGGKQYFINAITEISAHDNAIVDLYKVQDEQNNAYHIERVETKLGWETKFSHYNISFGGGLVRSDLNTKLAGEYGECNYWGLYLGVGKQHIDNHTFVDHAKPNCPSNELYKGILDDESKGVFNGKILVQQPAQKTNAYQSNKTVLLSKKATIDTKPQLEIYADDVKCSHGATVGHLDDTAYFYIRSRGVPEEAAMSMLIQAFANDVVEKIKIDKLREQLNHMIFEHLHQDEIR